MMNQAVESNVKSNFTLFHSKVQKLRVKILNEFSALSNSMALEFIA